MIQNQLDKSISEDISNIKRLAETVWEISEECTECKKCVKQCAFLKKYGTPKQIADTWLPENRTAIAKSFECSLCSLCTAVCPVKIDPRQMFLAMRRYAVASGKTDFRLQKPLINFEKRGTSRRFSFYGLPTGCDTVLFPGCALAGSRPHRVMQLFDHLQTYFPNLGIVLDCCTKPSHDLGRTDHFHAMFAELQHYLFSHAIKTVLVACPSCLAVFQEYGKKLATRSVYEVLARENWQPEILVNAEQLTIQDSCVARFDESIQAAVRKLIRARGLAFAEMKHHGRKTLCCGEGGAAHFVAPELAGNWGAMRREEVHNRQVITYCAGCANFLSKVSRTAHVLDLLFDPAKTLAGRVKVSRSPFTYVNRLLLKRKFQKKMKYGFSRERTFVARDL